MAQVKDFVKNVQSDIKAVIEQRKAAGVKDTDLDILLRLESQWSSDDLQKILDSHSNDSEAVSPASLKFLLDFLRGRYELIKDTDAIYNHHPKSLANVVCTILAKHLSQALSTQAETKHYYEFLFPHLRCADYVTSKGDLSALELHEFFLSDAGIPVETLVCLEKYREVTVRKRQQITPFHVCLPEGHVHANASLNPGEINRMNSYSGAAELYYKAISAIPMKSADELDFFKNKLLTQVSAENFAPKYTYTDTLNTTKQCEAASNVNLLKHDFLARIGVTDLQSFARLLSTTKDIDISLWFDFVESIDNVFLDQVVLPKIVEKQPSGTLLKRVITDHPGAIGRAALRDEQIILLNPDNTKILLTVKYDTGPSMRQLWVTPDGAVVLQSPDKSILLRKPNDAVLEPDKFATYLESPLYDKDSASLLNRALPFLILYRYIRKLDDEPDGVLDGIIGDEKKVKRPPAILLLKFLTDLRYLINQPDTYFQEMEALVHLPPCKRGRLGCIYRKLISLGPTMFESAENLSKFADILSRTPGDQWAGVIPQFANFKNMMQKYVDASGGMVKCIKSQNYIQGADRYNRAILFLINEFYIIDRAAKDEVTGKGGYGKNKKVPAAEILRGFFSSDHPLNDLEGYLKSIPGGMEHLPVIQDINNHYASMFRVTEPSVLNTLATQAAELCKPEYYVTQEANRQKKMKQLEREQPRKKHG